MADKQRFSPLLVDGLSGQNIEHIVCDMDLLDRDNEILSRDIIGEHQIGLFEKALKLQLEALSFAGENVSQWSLSDKVIVAMAARVFNHLRASMKLLLSGYWVESLVLQRSAHETMSRELYFYFNPQQTEQFFEGKQIKQEEVDKKLAQKFADDGNSETIKEIYGDLRKSYKRSSEHSHPNLLAVQLQTFSDTKEDIGSKSVLGPFLHQDIAALHFAGLIALAFSATSILARVACLYQATEAWHEQYKELANSVKAMASSYGVSSD